MRLAVFGATGRTGRLVVDDAVERGHDVTAPVRSQPDPPFPRSVRVQVIDFEDRTSIEPEIKDVDAVLWAIGPVTGVTVTEVSDAMRRLVEAMVDADLRRVVAAANTRVFTDDEVTGEYANVAAEHRRNAAILDGSELEWTILAAPSLNDDPPTGRVDTVIDAKAAGRSLTRGDFAANLLDAIDRPEWIGHRIGVANR